MNDSELVRKYLIVKELLEKRGFNVGPNGNDFMIDWNIEGKPRGVVARINTVDGLIGFLEGLRANE